MTGLFIGLTIVSIVAICNFRMTISPLVSHSYHRQLPHCMIPAWGSFLMPLAKTDHRLKILPKMAGVYSSFLGPCGQVRYCSLSLPSPKRRPREQRRFPHLPLLIPSSNPSHLPTVQTHSHHCPSLTYIVASVHPHHRRQDFPPMFVFSL